MATAYAAVVSLLNTMDQIQNHPRLSTCFNSKQFESLGEKVDFFLDFVMNSPNAESTEAENVMRRIAVAAAAAEHITEVEVADRIVEGFTGKSPSLLAEIIQDMDSIKEEVMKVKEEAGVVNSMSPPSSSSSTSPPPATGKTSIVVGFEGYVEQLFDELTGHHRGRKIIPVVGMGGIGKTTLARTVYHNSNIVHHFHIRAWITVSQEFSARKFFLQALSCLGVSTSDMATTNDQQLSLELYQILFKRRYLIILDDVWSVKAWDRIKNSFPENHNRSRIVVTTRESKLVEYFGSSAFSVDFLDEENSWNLFCDKAFAQQGCPSELERIGKQIVKKCKGLPLAIILVGGILGRSPRNQEYWERIANDKSLILDSGEGDKPLSILHLSYKHLPVWLKSCFLYLRLFPEDEKIDVPELIKLFVAEGLIKPCSGKCLEEVAESYIKELVGRNLVLVHEYVRPNKKIYVHDLVRDMCISIAEKENFLSIQRDIDGTQVFILDERTSRFFHQNSDTSETPSVLSPRRIHLEGKVPSDLRLLRVSICVESQSDYIIQQVNLRFLNLEVYDSELSMIWTYKLPSSISLLWSLQTLFIGTGYTVVAPSEIWEMRQLRHISIWSLSLPDPPEDNLCFAKLTDSQESGEPHLDRPSVEASSCYHLQNVGFFEKLESLQYSCKGFEYAGDSLQNLKWPCYLKELNLEGCNLDWKMIGSLPHLEVLDLHENAVVGGEWNCGEDEFICLKHLHIDRCCDLIKWSASSSNFPVLETLSLWFLPQLCEIPSDIGAIGTLENMKLYDCGESATMSAVEILEEKHRLGNEGLVLVLDFFEETDADMWREKIQLRDFTCQNLRIWAVNGAIDEEEMVKIVDMIAEM